MEQDWTEFWQWVDKMRQDAGLSWYRMEEIGGMANNTLSFKQRENKEPSLRNMQAIATALNISLSEVLQQAGVIDPAEEATSDITLRGMMRLMRGLSVDQRKELLDYALFRFHK